MKQKSTTKQLSATKKAELAKLAAMPDSQIDYSDAPSIPTERWLAEGVRGKFYRPIKNQITVRIDADVLDWLKRQGKGHLTRINEILRAEMQRAK